MPLAGRRPGARRVAAALFELGGDALARGARVVTGRGADAGAPEALDRSADAPRDEHARRVAAAEEAAARLDAARERLRATIPTPGDDDAPQQADSPQVSEPSDPQAT